MGETKNCKGNCTIRRRKALEKLKGNVKELWCGKN